MILTNNNHRNVKAQIESNEKRKVGQKYFDVKIPFFFTCPKDNEIPL